MRSREPSPDSLAYCYSLFEAMGTKQKTKLITADAAYQAIFVSKHVRDLVSLRITALVPIKIVDLL